MTAGPRSTADRPRARGDVVFRALVEEWVLYDPATRNLHALNHTAALVWSLCDGTLDEDAMVRALNDLLPDPPPEGVLRADLREALAIFRREGLLS